MTERNHNFARWGLGFAAVMAILIVGIIIGALLRTGDSDSKAPPPPISVPAPDKAKPPAASVPLLPLERPQLLAAAAAAADAVAGGQPLPARNASLVGRSFVIRLPFGCDGPLADLESEWAGWNYNPKTHALKLRAQPQIWSEDPWAQAIAGQTPYEAIEGFWIRRSWTNAPTCPKALSAERSSSAGDGGARQTVGIAQFFAPGAPRTMRRGTRPYAVTLKADEDLGNDPREYHLLISGRITGFADGQPVHCWNEADHLPPVCLIAAEFSRVAFEDVRGGKTLSEWRN